MGGGEDGEDVEEGGPDDDEEEDYEDGDGPGGHVLGGPEVEPVAAVGGGEPVILDYDYDEEPLGRVVSEGVQWKKGTGGRRTMMIFLLNREV